MEVESATRSTGGTLDWWVKARQEWWDRVAVKTVVNDAIRGNACHTWNAEEDIAESQVHLLLACRCDKSVDHRRRRAGKGQVPLARSHRRRRGRAPRRLDWSRWS
jgi:hypothetical protein